MKTKSDLGSVNGEIPQQNLPINIATPAMLTSCFSSG